MIVKCTHCISVVCYWYYELNWGSMAHITFICRHLFLLSVLSHYTMFWHFVPLYIRFYVISIIIIALRHIFYHLIHLSMQPYYEEYCVILNIIHFIHTLCLNWLYRIVSIMVINQFFIMISCTNTK